MNHPSTLAHKLAAMGRKGDTELLHVSRDELRGLASLGKLTVNPKTGLLEAWSLGGMLPMAAAVASEYFFPGNPWASAIAAGGTSALQGGSMQSVMSNAALAGGGSSLFDAVAGSGAANAGLGAGVGDYGAGPKDWYEGDTNIGGGGEGNAGGIASQALSPWDAMKAKASSFASNLSSDPSGVAKDLYDNHKMAGMLTVGGAAGLAGLAASQQQAALMDQRRKMAMDAEAARLAGVKQGPMSQTVQDPQSLYDTYAARFAPKGYADGGEVKTKMAEVEADQRRNAAELMTEMMRRRYVDTGNAIGKSGDHVGGQIFDNLFPFEPDPRDGWTERHARSQKQRPTGYAGGGVVSLAHGGLAPMPGSEEEIQHRRSAAAFIRNSYPDIKAARADLRNPDSPLIALGIRSPQDPLLAAAFGGVVEGPGTGTSDSVPAVINGTTPAALSDGEFVVPAHAVSALGAGSTKAGANKLHSMLDRINRRSKKAGNEVMPA